MLVLIGQIGSDGGERDRTDAWLSAGVDNATSTENAANAGFSFVGGLYGLFEFGWTLRLTQDLNHAFRSRLFERIQSLPLSQPRRRADRRRGLPADVRHAVDHRDVLPDPARHHGGTVRCRALRVRDLGQLPRGEARALRAGPRRATLAATWPFSRLLRERGLRSRGAGSTATSSLEEGVSNILAVQSQGGEARERERFDRESTASFARHRGVILLAMLAALCAVVPGVLVVRGAFLEVVDLGSPARSAWATCRCW